MPSWSGSVNRLDKLGLLVLYIVGIPTTNTRHNISAVAQKYVHTQTLVLREIVHTDCTGSVSDHIFNNCNSSQRQISGMEIEPCYC